MSPEPLRIRVLSALELQPMTKAQLARCLSCSYSSVEQIVGYMHKSNIVRIRGNIRPVAKRRPEWVWELAA